MAEAKWYIVHAYSNFEKKVASTILEQAERKGLAHLIEDMQVPTEEVVEVARGKKKTVERRYFPGYVLMKAVMTDDVYHLVKDTPKVSGFLGAAWRLDALYGAVILTPVRLISQGISALIDKLVVDGAVNGAAAIARLVGDDTRKMTTGSVKSYAVWMGFGAAALSLLLIWI